MINSNLLTQTNAWYADVMTSAKARTDTKQGSEYRRATEQIEKHIVLPENINGHIVDHDKLCANGVDLFHELSQNEMFPTAHQVNRVLTELTAVDL